MLVAANADITDYKISYGSWLHARLIHCWSSISDSIVVVHASVAKDLILISFEQDWVLS
jgi:hypothetical protein